MKGALAFVGMIAMLGSPAAAQTSGIYLRGDVGVALGSWSTETDTNPAASNASLGTGLLWARQDTGVIFDVGVGYRFAPFLRFEGTIGYIPSVDLNGTFSSTPSVTMRGNVSALVGLASAYFDVSGVTGRLPGNIQPFFLGSVGFATVNNGAEDDYFNGQYINTFSGTTMTNLAWGAGGGVGIPLSDRLTLDIAYRFLDLGERRVGPVLTSPGPTTFETQDRANLQTHTITIGLRFDL